jgi:hypothetical protein
VCAFSGKRERPYSLREADQAALRGEMVDLWTSHNRAKDGSRTIVDAEDLEVVGVRA